jgi:hypothetical protein
MAGVETNADVTTGSPVCTKSAHPAHPETKVVKRKSPSKVRRNAQRLREYNCRKAALAAKEDLNRFAVERFKTAYNLLLDSARNVRAALEHANKRIKDAQEHITNLQKDKNSLFTKCLELRAEGIRLKRAVSCGPCREHETSKNAFYFRLRKSKSAKTVEEATREKELFRRMNVLTGKIEFAKFDEPQISARPSARSQGAASRQSRIAGPVLTKEEREFKALCAKKARELEDYHKREFSHYLKHGGGHMR